MAEPVRARVGERFSAFAARHIAGSVLTSGSLIERCSTDMSIFRRTPAAVLRPRDESDIMATLSFARAEAVPITARAGGSNTAGAALTNGIVLLFDRGEEWSRLTYDPDSGEITAGPAARHDELQALLRLNGRTLPSDPSSGPLSRIGGNIATKASGPHALKHGAVDRYLMALRVVTNEGDVIATDRPRELPARIRDGVEEIRRRALADEGVLELLRRRRDMKIASGYNLFALLEEDAHLRLARLLAGSVGTLGIVTEARLRTVAVEAGRTTVEVFFDTAHAAVGAASRAVELGAAACEFLNRECIRIVRERHPELELPEAGSLLLLEFTGEGHHHAAAALARELGSRGSPAPRISSDPDVQTRLWEVRK
ncbi:MAG: FAD-binding protein, partial [Spirochaetes bacterium]|nr:FAD-binding protein [Spirochaetota bacterium]